MASRLPVSLFLAVLLATPALAVKPGAVHVAKPVSPRLRPPPLPKDPWLPAVMCPKPFLYLCDGRFNPFVGYAVDAEKQFMTMLETTWAKYRERLPEPPAPDGSLPAARPRLSPSSGPAGSQQMLTMTEATKRTNADLDAQLFTKERTAKARSLFAEAKSGMSEMLEDKRRFFEERGLAEEAAAVSEVKDCVEKAQLVLGSNSIHGGPRLLDFNAFFAGSVAEGPPGVHLEAMILLVDRVPGTLKSVFLHELGHCTISLISSLAKKVHLFPKETACLSREDTGAVKSADIACWKDSVAYHARLYPGPTFAKLREQYALVVKSVLANPDAPAPDPPPGLTCQRGQLVEALADYLHGEASRRQRKKLRQTDRRRVILEEAAGHCAHYHAQMAAAQREPALAYSLASSAHSNSGQRIDRFCFSHPEALDAPCADPLVHEVAGVDEPIVQGRRGYCGEGLYPPVAKEKSR